MNDLVIVSVDDHITEPPDVFERVLSGPALASAPQFRTAPDGSNYWEYQGAHIPSIGLNAVVGRPPEEYGVEPTALSQLRKGCYDVHARIEDMNVNGIAASLNFASCVGFEGGVFHRAADKAQALTHLRAYNDWHIDVWCAAYPGRFIACGILPAWDMDAAVAEVKRLAAKGCTAVSLNENPTKLGLPSIHDAYWEPLWRALTESDVTICLHIGGGNPAPHASMDSPIEAWITTMPMSIVVGAADWLHLEALKRYPTLRIALSEGSIGWVPYFMERADFAHEHHKAWTNSKFETRPSDLFRRHFMNCFIDDAFGLKNVDELGEDAIAYECDYPHSDTLWPHAPERLWATLKHLRPEVIEKIACANAMRFFRFDPFQHHARADLTVGALRARAAAAKVDVTPKSQAGAKPLKADEAGRIVTSGDIMRMFANTARASAGKAA
jgi:predicted TIM-barrel fold metal-dependent hydrolase